MFGRYFLFRCEYHKYGIHIQLIMLIMANTIENESKNRVQIDKMAIEQKT